MEVPCAEAAYAAAVELLANGHHLRAPIDAHAAFELGVLVTLFTRIPH